MLVLLVLCTAVDIVGIDACFDVANYNPFSCEKDEAASPMEKTVVGLLLLCKNCETTVVDLLNPCIMTPTFRLDDLSFCHNPLFIPPPFVLPFGAQASVSGGVLFAGRFSYTF